MNRDRVEERLAADAREFNAETAGFDAGAFAADLLRNFHRSHPYPDDAMAAEFDAENQEGTADDA